MYPDVPRPQIVVAMQNLDAIPMVCAITDVQLSKSFKDSVLQGFDLFFEQFDFVVSMTCAWPVVLHGL